MKEYNMGIIPLQDILPFIEKPSRYLGSEKNSIKKDLDAVKLKFSLVFPDLYEIGTSHFGIQILYNILNNHKYICAERVFAPGLDMEAFLRDNKKSIFSLESQLSLNEFDIIGFSLLYELNFTNVLTILDLANIPFFSSERDETHPFIIGGGPCTFNPEPVADFFDALVIGDGESVIMEMSEAWLEWKYQNISKNALLEKWAKIQGVYIPSFFSPVYKKNTLNFDSYQTLDFNHIEAIYPDYEQIQKAIIPDLENSLFPDAPIVPYGKPIHDRLRLEISRGCSRGCRFCQAGMIYRPVRERSLQSIIDITKRSLENTGYNDISLLSLSTGDYSNLSNLMEFLMCGGFSNQKTDNHTSVSLPSIRAGVLSPLLMNLIKKERKTGFTIAPEAGTDRLRKFLNKGITEKDIFDTVENAFNLGWKVIKLYFMIGLPSEQHDDIIGIVDLVKKLSQIKSPGGKKAKINVSVTTFIPKPHTPFQWYPQISLEYSKEKISFLREALRIKGVQFKWQDPEVSLLEGIWARGDRRLSSSLVTAYEKGCNFDGWSDHFKFDSWKEAFSENNINIDYYTIRNRDIEEPLPWDHISTGIKKSFYTDELKKSKEYQFSPDCRDGECTGCGICNFETIKPVVNKIKEVSSMDCKNTTFQNDIPFKITYILKFSKIGKSRFFGHLELINIFIRALKRINSPLFYSQGFHPKPKISFFDTLPVGMESLEEYFSLQLTENIDPKVFIESLNNELPEGIKIESCSLKSSGSNYLDTAQTSYLIKSNNIFLNPDKISEFKKGTDIIIEKISKKGRVKEINLSRIILKIELLDSFNLLMLLNNDTEGSIRPAVIIKKIFNISDESIKRMNIVKVPINFSLS